MKFDIPDGFVVIPLNAVGAPIGIALWCATPEQFEEVFNQEGGGEGNALLVHCYRSSEAPSPAREYGEEHRKLRLRKIEPKHRVEE